MFRTAVILFFMITTLTTILSQTGTTQVENFNWLAGAWITEQENTVIEEVWMAPRADLMTGMGRTVFANNKSFFEFMRIAKTDSGICFFGSPKGENTTPFKLTKAGENFIEFENLSHDFPQRILYKLIKSDKLYARVEGIVNNKLEFEEWNYSRNNNFGR